MLNKYPEGTAIDISGGLLTPEQKQQLADLADRFNTGKPKLSYILSAPRAMECLADVFEYGATKYARDNWKKGFKTTELTDSLLRHLSAYMSGEDIDGGKKGSQLPHVGHILWNALILAEMHLTRPDLDDRYKPETKGNLQ